MRGLPILIRLARQRADAQRIALAEAERQTATAAASLTAHDAVMTAETAQARGETAGMAAWTDWARQSRRRRAGLAQAVALLRDQEDTARDALRDAFAEIKRLEIALDIATRAERREVARKAERGAEDAELMRRR